MPFKKWPSITRRGLFKATAITGVTAGAISILAGCSHPSDEDAEAPVVVDKNKAHYVINPETNESVYSVTDLPISEDKTYNLPLGSVLRPGDGDWLAMTSVGTTSKPAILGAALSVSAGTVSNVVTSTVTGDTPSIAIFDVRCSDSTYAWVEMDLLTKSWALYAAPFSNGELTGTSSTLWKANSNWDPPRMAVAGDKVIWQVMPSKTGNKTTENSRCYLWKLGSSEARVVVESPGRFATGPEISGTTVTMSPRVHASKGVFYGITAYSLDDNLKTVVDQLVLPQSVSPMFAVRIGEKFVFSIEASYAAGGLLASMGTYIGASDGPFVVLPREPAAEVAGKDGLYIVKSRSSYFVINTEKERYSTLSAADRTVDYGDFPARDGECKTFVSFATVKDATTGYPASVEVRTFQL